MKSICITGSSGQLGSWLVESYLNQGYKVYGLKRRSSSLNTERLNHLYKDPHISNQLELVYGDLADGNSINQFVGDAKPDYFINAAAMSHVAVSFGIPIYSMDVTGTGVLRCLEAIRQHSPKTKFLTLSSSEMFGASPPPQDEKTLFHPRSPYAVAKVAGYYATINYREAYGLFAANAICFNFEGPTRGETFVTRKITRAATRIKLGLQDKLYLGNLEAKRDWNHIKDTARAIQMIIEADKPDDFVISTGKMHSVKEFLEVVFSKLGMDWKDYVEIDQRYFRPTEVDALCGSSKKLKETLGWEPQFTFDELVDEMIASDMKLAEQEKLLAGK